jgi:hypothetical protein
MIRRADGGDWLIIRQPDHAAPCGLFAERWGSGPFEPVAPREAVIFAAREHDNGWAEWEAAPSVDPEAARPRNFTEMPIPEVLAIWGRGPGRAAERDPYAGLLVSLHASRLFGPRLAAGRDPAEDQERLRGYLEEQARYQAKLRAALGVAEDMVAAHSRLIGTWDRLSLLLCCGPIPAASLEEVPARQGAVAVNVIPDGERSAALDPYPFAGGPLAVAVPARRIPARPYRTPEALREALATAPAETLEFTLHAP